MNTNTNNAKQRMPRRITEDDYQRPSKTFQDTLQNKADMLKYLENYKRVENVDDIPLNSHMRYVTLDKNNKQVFRIGGFLKQIKPNYIVLTSGTLNWCVQRYHYAAGKSQPIFNTVFWYQVPKEELLMEKLIEQESKINKLEKTLNYIKNINGIDYEASSEDISVYSSDYSTESTNNE
jgi:hypothetical protein